MIAHCLVLGITISRNKVLEGMYQVTINMRGYSDSKWKLNCWCANERRYEDTQRASAEKLTAYYGGKNGFIS